jgi:hypothetical protein
MKNINLLWLLLLIPAVLVQTYVYPVTLAIIAVAYLASRYLKVDQREQSNLDIVLGDRIEDISIEQDKLKSELQEVSDKLSRIQFAVSQRNGPVQR